MGPNVAKRRSERTVLCTGTNGQERNNETYSSQQYLFINHTEYRRRLESGELEISAEALNSLERQSELASVDTADAEDDMSPDAATEYGIIQPALESGFVDHQILVFDKCPNLYLKKTGFHKDQASWQDRSNQR
jgi:hypothetical protein